MRRFRTLLTIIALVSVAALWLLLTSDQAVAAPEPTPDPAVEDFVPSEELPTDSAISFPVDI